MTNQQNEIEWRIIGETVAGATHTRAGTANQDAILFQRESSRALPVILSVADGHGSPKCFRSDRGSQFAVKKAAYLLTEFLDERRGAFDLAEIERQKDAYRLDRLARHRWPSTAIACLPDPPCDWRTVTLSAVHARAKDLLNST